MTERHAKTHILEKIDLASILEPQEFTSRPAECKGMPLCHASLALLFPTSQKGCLVMLLFASYNKRGTAWALWLQFQAKRTPFRPS